LLLFGGGFCAACRTKGDNSMNVNITVEKLMSILKKNLATLLAVAFLCFGGGFAYVKLFVDPSYYANADFYIKDTATVSSGTSDINRTRLLADTFLQMLNTDKFFSAVRENLPADVANRYTASQLHSGASFSVLNNTEIIRVRFTSLRKADVVPVLNAVLDSIPTHIENVYGQAKCSVVDEPAKVLVSSTKTSVVCALSMIVGVAAVFILLLVKDILDVHIRTASQLSERYGVPILGSVPEFNKIKTTKKEGANDGNSNK
jgi:capsular polysaccharide biosynthesis protein